MRWILRLELMALIVMVVTSVLSAFAANNQVSASYADHDTQSITVNNLKPSQCSGITLVNKIVGSGTITGTNQADLIVGSTGPDTIRGGGGADCIVGGDGNDTLEGQADTDVLLGGPGDDYLDGGSGKDTCYSGSTIRNCEVIYP